MISLGIELVKSFNDRYITMYKTVIKTTEDFKSKAKEIFGDYYDYTKTDILKKDSKRRVIITCPKHGDFLQDMYSHLNGCGCPKCGKENMAKTQSFTKEQFVDKANIVHNFKYKYTTTVYNGATKNVDIICPIHGIFTQKAYSHLQGHGCPKCATKRNADNMLMTKEDFVKKAIIIHNGTENYDLSEYKGAKVPIEIICSKGHHYWQMPNKHLNGHGCPYCANNVSSQENEISDFIENEIGLNVIKNNRKLLTDRKEIDIYIPSKNLAIEHNGLIWHSEEHCKDRYYHLKKTEGCIKQGIQLIHIFEDEWVFKKDIVKSKIREITNSILNIVDFNECVVKKVSVKQCKDFLKANSFYETVNVSDVYGSFYKDELISLLVLNKTDNSDEYELITYCNKLNTVVIEGIRNLFDIFVKDKKPLMVKAKVDRRWDNGNLFEKIGFKHIKDTEPNYYYVVNRHRYLKPINLMKEAYRIFDCGNSIYEWKRF